jgi:hypothetical protein
VKDSRIHWSFWTIGVIALIWNILGCINFIMQLNPDSTAAMPEPYRAVIEARPAWATGAFGVAVFGGALGTVVLLLRRSAAYYLFTVSLLAALVTVAQFHSVAGLDFVGAAAGSSMQVVGSFFLVWYSRWVNIRGWAGRGARSDAF